MIGALVAERRALCRLIELSSRTRESRAATVAIVTDSLA